MTARSSVRHCRRCRSPCSSASRDVAPFKSIGPDASSPIRVPPLTHAERLECWRRAVPSAANHAVLAELARRFRYERAAIERVGAELAARERTPTVEELLAAARADLELGALAQPVTPRFDLTELMLPPRANAPDRRLRHGDEQPHACPLRMGHRAGMERGRAGGIVCRAAGHGQDHGRRGDRERAGAAALSHRPVAGRQQIHRRDRKEPAPAVRRRRFGGRDPVLRRGRRAVRQANRGQGRARPVRQSGGQLPARTHGALQGHRDPRDQSQAGSGRSIPAPAALRGRFPAARRGRAPAHLAGGDSAGRRRKRARPRIPGGALPAGRRPHPRDRVPRLPAERRRRRGAHARRCRRSFAACTASTKNSIARAASTSSGRTRRSLRRKGRAHEAAHDRTSGARHARRAARDGRERRAAPGPGACARACRSPTDRHAGGALDAGAIAVGAAPDANVLAARVAQQIAGKTSRSRS